MSAPGFGLFKNSSIFQPETFQAVAWYMGNSSINGQEDHLQLELNLIVDEQFDGEVKIIGELTHPNLENVLLEFRHINLMISYKKDELNCKSL